MFGRAVAGASRRIAGATRAALKGCRADRSGGVAVIFGLMGVVLCMAIGGAVDFSRWMSSRGKTLQAIDAAVLAGGRSLQTDSKNWALAVATAKKFYDANLGSGRDAVEDTFAFQVADNGSAMTVTGSAYVKTSFLRLASIDKIPLLRLDGSEYAKAVLKAGGNAEQNVEIALMLDVTGSMKPGTKFADLKTAAKDLVDITVYDNQSTYTSRVAIVPFAEDVRLPTSATTLARGTVASTISKILGWLTLTYKVTPCVVERAGNDKYTDAVPAAGKFVMARYDTGGSCDSPTENTVQPLTNDKSVLNAKIEDLKLAGGTAGQIGTAWAWYALSPNFNSLWPTANKAADYDTSDKPNVVKYAVLMTDGEYNTEYDASGVQVGTWGSGSAANASSTSQARSLCTAMKAKGITVYTVGFDLGGNQTAIDTLSECATSAAHFFNTSSGDELRQAFRAIALTISELYLAH